MKNKLKKLLLIITSVIVSLTYLCSCTFTFTSGMPTELKFTLTQQEVDNYLDVISDVKVELPKASNVLTASSHVKKLVDGMAYVNEQSMIAQILYYQDMSNAQAKENLDFCIDSFTKCSTGYKDVILTLWNSNSPLKAQFFEGMTEADILARFNPSTEIATLNGEIERITAEYEKLSNAELETQIGDIYKQIVIKHNRIATLSNFDNYYNYSANYVHERDYEATTLTNVLKFVKQYFIPLYVEINSALKNLELTLTPNEKQEILDFTKKPYSQFTENHIENYINTLPTSAKKGMNNMFTRHNYVVTNNENALEGAFTTTLLYNEIPYCYFGPGYQSLFTIVHELGHYYATYANIQENIPLDVSETQSQSNEMLFLVYLDDVVSQNSYEYLRLSQILNMLKTIIVSTLVNEFEMRIYNTNVSNFTTANFNNVMEKIVTEFGKQFVTDVMKFNYSLYWKRVVVRQPCYYISYAVSGISALSFYCQAMQTEETYNVAKTKYVKLCTNNYEDGFQQVLNRSGYDNPFGERTYYDILESVETYVLEKNAAI